MDTPLVKVIWTTLRTVFYSEPWFEWAIPVAAVAIAAYLLFAILSRTSYSKMWKIFLTALFVPIAVVLFNIPNFYENFRAGSSDRNCPEVNINPLTGEIEPIKYDYMWLHAVPGPADTGFVELFLKQHEIFGENQNVKNSHVCRLPYDEKTKKLLQNLKDAQKKQGDAAKKAGVPAERFSEFGEIKITLPGSAESRAKMDSFLRKRSDEKKKGEKDRDDSFGNAEFKAPERENAPKQDGTAPTP
ncbi:MAG: hypothetical protein A2835_01270 [Candidatus Niyogibacteria bacterium RIFCSPHIGHO2_01_FULL_45_28]|uniref:Uncharacterized protein n=1 Tax=Candidatus Niyogibacteria bacterium RIFCSPLOWO2_02_FULL_45_13 TaxID=1801725 RepID=A0A1G2EZI4_9BACT|nr:MAG: hypothetical protein A2835_01270 [Candidatus Niyogibacteria bacterium RIFCSPHIGHO2_01_FULL_45_28]OGZ31153.1 MAG: hypothetical protein A3J00_01220 [Candidatus Niyogibacteria bacterium RIFCSPLOWO2_02_FULL_45_13]